MFKQFKVALILLVLVLAGMSLVFVFRPSPPRVVVMSIPKDWPTRKQSLFAKLEASAPKWFWLLKERMLGPAKTITLDTAVHEFRDWPESGQPGTSFGQAEGPDRNGLQVWIIDEGELKTFERRLKKDPGETISRTRVITAHGIRGMVTYGRGVSLDGSQGFSGVALDFFPRVGRDSIDLSMVATVSEAVTNDIAATTGHQPTNVVSVRTNLAVAARIQIPNGSGVFLLNKSQEAKNGKRIGVLISATQPQPK